MSAYIERPKVVLMKQKEYNWKQIDDGITAFRWKDKKCVNFPSNYHYPKVEIKVTRKEKDGSITKIPGPKILSDYNFNMNFVDNFDL